MTDKASVYQNNTMINREVVLKMIYSTVLPFVLPIMKIMIMQDITSPIRAYKYYKTQVVELNLIKLIRKWSYQVLRLGLSFKEK